jgi:Opacity protein and related surface antigens
MNKFVTAAAAAALFAVPAAANAQAYVQVETGLDSVSANGEAAQGVIYGASAGYDLPLSGGMFVGVQGTVADSSTKDCLNDVLAVGDRACLKTGRDLAAVVRLGTAIGDRSKLYVFGGYTNARIRLTYDDGITSTSDGQNGDGVRVGAGYEYDLSNNLFVKAEYRYSNYESDVSRNQGVVALGVKF